MDRFNPGIEKPASAGFFVWGRQVSHAEENIQPEIRFLLPNG
jgi:hypothetical protein